MRPPQCNNFRCKRVDTKQVGEKETPLELSAVWSVFFSFRKNKNKAIYAFVSLEDEDREYISDDYKVS